jgi:aerobic-type carbon monoxide dehydrogenase small subunit (CoxS/CutS family)
VTELVPTSRLVDDGGGFVGDGEPPVLVRLTVDGTPYELVVDPTMAALKAIREFGGHERPRRGCQEGICGKCESVVDGVETRLCITAIGALEGASVVTPTPRRSMWSV